MQIITKVKKWICR